MNEALIISMLTYAFITTITPGPNNLMVMSSVMLFGVKRTLPHMFGNQMGFSLLVMAAALGLGELLNQLPEARLFVMVAGAAWLCWLGVTFLKEAFRQHVSQGRPVAKKTSRPFRFYEAAFFQWVNPKGLIVSLSAAGLYVGIAEDVVVRTLVMGLGFLLVGLMGNFTWMMLGRTLNRWLGDASQGRVVNIIMALLIFGLVAMILLPEFWTS